MHPLTKMECCVEGSGCDPCTFWVYAGILCMYVCVCAFVCVCICVCVYLCVYICVCVGVRA